MTTPLTPQQLQAALDEIKASREKDAADLDARIAWEAKRNTIAFNLVAADRALPWSEALEKAASQLGTSSSAPMPNQSTQAAPAPEETL